MLGACPHCLHEQNDALGTCSTVQVEKGDRPGANLALQKVVTLTAGGPGELRGNSPYFKYRNASKTEPESILVFPVVANGGKCCQQA